MKTNKISVMPVKKYAPPKYPTLTVADREPALLRKLPSRWQKNAAVVAAVGLLGTITLTSCGILDSKIKGYNPTSENFLNVAPVFVHGEGIGSMGCMMIVPPVFLSEEEALAIIKSSAEDNGLIFEAEPPEYVATNNKPKEKSQYSWENPKYVLGGGNVGLDLYDAQKGIASAFISMEEAETLPDPSSIKSYHPYELAGLTVEDFSQQRGDISVGVFYDPGIDWDNEKYKKLYDEYNSQMSEISGTYDEANPDEYTRKSNEILSEYETDVKALIGEQLRAQVRDFIEWLQGQGII